MREIDQSNVKTAVKLDSQLDKQSIPLNNKDVIARAKEMKKMELLDNVVQGESSTPHDNTDRLVMNSYNDMTYSTLNHKLVDKNINTLTSEKAKDSETYNKKYKGSPLMIDEQKNSRL